MPRPAADQPDKQGADPLGADLQGLGDSNPFHPTGVGVLRMASAVVQVVLPEGRRPAR